MSESASWRRWIIEGFVIVASILLAFAIDAGWDAREEGRQREALVSALRSDFEIAAAALERARRLHEAGRGATGELLVLTELGPLDVGAQAAVDSLLGLSLVGGDAVPPTGTLETLFNSGRLNLIDDPETVVRLTALTGLLEYRRSQDRWIDETVVGLIHLMGSVGIDPARISGADDALERLSGDVFAIPWSRGPTDAWQVVHTPDFRGRLSLMWFVYNNSLRNIDEMQTLIEETLPGLR